MRIFALFVKLFWGGVFIFENPLLCFLIQTPSLPETHQLSNITSPPICSPPTILPPSSHAKSSLISLPTNRKGAPSPTRQQPPPKALPPPPHEKELKKRLTKRARTQTPTVKLASLGLTSSPSSSRQEVVLARTEASAGEIRFSAGACDAPLLRWLNLRGGGDKGSRVRGWIEGC